MGAWRRLPVKIRRSPCSLPEELAGYESAKGSVQFPLDQPILYDLISKIVEFRVRLHHFARPAGKQRLPRFAIHKSAPDLLRSNVHR
jgi:hypothetical protein